MTDKRQKATKVKCKREESLTKQSMFVEYSLLFSRRTIWDLLELVGRWTQHFTKIDQKTRNIGHDYWIFYVNIDLRHQYGISAAELQTFLHSKCPQLRGARRNGCFRGLLSRVESLITQRVITKAVPVWGVKPQFRNQVSILHLILNSWFLRGLGIECQFTFEWYCAHYYNFRV